MKTVFAIKSISIVGLALISSVLSSARLGAEPADDSTSGSAPVQRVAKISLNEVTIVAEKKGWLKEEFDKYGAKAKLVACAVTVVPPLINRGDVNIANSMHGFSFVQLLNGFDPVIVWQSGDVDPRTVVIAVLADSPIKTLADLNGKTMGVAKWTCGYYGVSEALKNAGVPLDTKLVPGKVRYLNLTDGLSVTTVLLAGRVDAIATHPSGLASLYLQGLIRDIGTAVPGGKFVHSDRIVYYCKPSWAKENPDLIKAFTIAQNKALYWIHAHRSEAAAIVAKQMRQPEDVMEAQFHEPGNQRLFLPERDYASAIEAFKVFQKLAISNSDGLVTESRKKLTDEQIGRLIDRRFFRGGEYYAGDEQAGEAPKTASSSNGQSSIAPVALADAR